MRYNRQSARSATIRQSRLPAQYLPERIFGTVCIHGFNGILDYRTQIRRFIANFRLRDEGPIGLAATVPMNKGGMVIIHGRMPHGSGPNKTDRVRWSMDLRWHDARKPGGRPLPGMLIRSRSHPLTSYDEWVRAWEIAKRDATPKKMYRWQT